MIRVSTKGNSCQLSGKALSSAPASPRCLLYAAPRRSHRRRRSKRPPSRTRFLSNTGGVEGQTAKETWYKQWGDPFVRNVSRATLTPFLPDPAKANGAAVIVAPGGGFRILSMGNEGWEVAQALNERGVAAFVLKYRLMPTAPDWAEFDRGNPLTAPTPGAAARRRARALADGIAARRRDRGVQTRARARQGMAHRSESHRHDGLLRGCRNHHGGDAAVDGEQAGLHRAYLRRGKRRSRCRPTRRRCSSRWPPTIRCSATTNTDSISAWKKAGRPVEFHLYQNGGHGFGLGNPGKTSTGWFPQFMLWLESNGMLKRD